MNGCTPRRPGSSRPYALITGGSGFVGVNVADRLLSDGRRVMILDNLSRPGVEQNLRWLKHRWAERVGVEVADIRDRPAVRRAVAQAEHVFHFAAQVAVTASLDDPLADHDVNLVGTLNLLEELRRRTDPPPLLFTSTNKVYGGLEDVALVEGADRYEPMDLHVRGRGIGENRPLAFCSPYGCSKGAADQYVLDYAATYGLSTAVFRMSCIYGPHQFGTEDQGWVAHFLISALHGAPINIYGDGKQVRDVLFVEDLVSAVVCAADAHQSIAGRAFNIGGGPGNTVSLIELLRLIAELRGEPPSVTFDDWRRADQRYYVSDLSAFTAATGWRPQVDVRRGVELLHDWLAEASASEGLADAAPRAAIR